MRRQVLETKEAVKILLNPQNVAFIGASTSAEKTSGLGFRNLLKADYAGNIYAVNRSGEPIDGHPTYKTIHDLPENIDLAFITLKAKLTPQTIYDLAEKNTKVAIVAVGGFAELGSQEGASLLDDLKRAGEETGIRMVGPVCNGIYNTHQSLPVGYNITHGLTLKKGGIGLVSHSGALLGPLVAAIEDCGAGLSSFISCGSEVDMGMSDYIEYLIDDPNTKVITLIVDRVGDGGRFRQMLHKARKAGKPVVALKLGDSDIGRQATKAHSSHLAGAKAAYETVLNAEGVIRVPTLESLAIVSAILSDGRRVTKPTVTACSTSGGGAIMMADRFAEANVSLCTLSKETVEKIGGKLRFGSATIINPFDLGLGGRDNYIANVENLASDVGTGVMVCYGTPMATEAKRAQMAHAFTDIAVAHPKLPVIVLFPGHLYDEERAIYTAAHVPVVPSTMEMVSIVRALVSGYRAKEPAAPSKDVLPAGVELLHGARGSQSEAESKAFLREAGIALPAERLVATIEQAAQAAKEIGYPVVLKACGKQIQHKSDDRLLAVGIESEEELRQEFQNIQARLDALPYSADGFLVGEMVSKGTDVIFGVTRDQEFGHIAILGPGGIWAELMGSDVMARAPLPLGRETIYEMIAQTPLKKLLNGYRGAAKADIEALVDVVEKVAAAVSKVGDQVSALDLNPIVVKEDGQGAWILDALLILKD